MRANRIVSTSSLAFIDVMSCGLGAVILLVILLDFKQSSDEVVLQKDIESVDERLTNEKNFSAKKKLLTQAKAERLKIDKLVSDVGEAMLQNSKKTIELAKTSDAPERELDTREISKANDSASGELIGLSITGRRILIAFDSSASMSHEHLIDIIAGLADKSGQSLSKGKKWLQAKRILLWAVRNAPDNSELQVLSYSNVVQSLTLGWVGKQDGLIKVNRSLKTLAPSGGTSLGNMLEYIENESIMPDSIYLITDGLPTLSGTKSAGIKSIKECFKIPSNKVSYVSGNCRVALFVGALERFGKTSNSTVNTILLPLEGDPKAAPLYWSWSNQTQGKLFSPSIGWPPI